MPQWLLWGSYKNLHDWISTLIISGTSFFRTDLPTYLAQFHRLQTCLGFLLLSPLLVVVHQIQSSNIVELENSTISNNTSVTTYVHRMVISPHVCLNTWRTMNVFLCFSSAFWIIHNNTCFRLISLLRKIMFQRVYTLFTFLHSSMARKVGKYCQNMKVELQAQKWNTVEPRLSVVMGRKGANGYAKMMDYPFYFNNCTIDMINKVDSLLQYKQWHSEPVSSLL